MDMLAQRRRRPRSRPQKTTGVVVPTAHDARGIAEPLERYGELLACQIVALYNAIHDLPERSDHSRARLVRLFHEAEGLPQTSQLLSRPEYQWRYGYNHQTVYRRAAGAGRLLGSFGLYDDQMLAWVNACRVVAITADPGREPPLHDAAASFVMSSIEIGIRRTPALQFISHVEVIGNASEEAKTAQSPLSIPVPALSHNFASDRTATLQNSYLRPDALFGVRYPPEHDPDFAFFALEYDRGTEDVEPAANLGRSSWLRKTLSYSAICAPSAAIHVRYLKVPALFVLCVFQDERRMANVMQLVARVAQDPRLFLFKTIPTVDPLRTTTPAVGLVFEPWRRVSGAADIRALYERR